MYKALIRSQIRRNVAKLNGGDHAPLRRAAAPDATLRFPGDNTWSRQFGRVASGVDGAADDAGKSSSTPAELTDMRRLDSGVVILTDQRTGPGA